MPITINGSGTITGAETLATTVVSPTLTTATLTAPTLTTPNINSAQFATVAGTAPIYPCRVWVNFNGTGTVAIRQSGNVTSITDNGTGDYTLNFTTAMPDVNFSVSATAGNDEILAFNLGRLICEFGMSSRTTSSCRVCTAYANHLVDSTDPIDASLVSVQVFR